MRIRLAKDADAEPLTRLINAAFRVEQPFIEGDRINPEGVRACGYLGLLGVEPKRQGAGLGRKLMDAAEDYFRKAGCRTIDLRIVSARTPLPAFYRYLGYVETGTAPFPAEVQTKVPCHYILMSKGIA